jgi:hypothetical protein
MVIAGAANHELCDYSDDVATLKANTGTVSPVEQNLCPYINQSE